MLDLLDFSKIETILCYGWIISNFKLYEEIYALIHNQESQFEILNKTWKEYLLKCFSGNDQQLILKTYGNSQELRYCLVWKKTIFPILSSQKELTLLDLNALIQDLLPEVDEWKLNWKPDEVYLGHLGWYLIVENQLQ